MRRARGTATRRRSRWFITRDPRGVKKPAVHAARAGSRCKCGFQASLGLIFLTLSKTGTYTGQVKVWACVGTVLAGTAILFPATPGAQAIQRSMYVSVLNEAGAPVPDLGPSDFLVREDNVAREVLRVVPADEPMQIAVLVDNSQAARDYIRDIRVAVEGFVGEMTSGMKNEISIIALAERPTILADASSDRVKIMKGVNRIFEQRGSGNYLLDGVIEVSKGFKKREAERPVIVAISTEGPEFSARRYEDVLKPLHDVGAAFHAIVLGPPSNDIGEDARNRSAVLDEGPRTSGGRRSSLLATSALPGELKRLAAELMQQYRITYARPLSLIPPERVIVSATRPGLTARGTLIKERREQVKP
jgi:hypothetical protein